LPPDQTADADADSTNELQALSFSNDTLYLSNGNFVVFPYDSAIWNKNGDTIYYNSGNIGINTTSPTEKLVVNGKVIATPITGRWSDSNGTSLFLQWDAQPFNTDTNYLGYVSGREYIEIKVAGYYSISVSCILIDVSANEITQLVVRRYNEFDVWQGNVMVLVTEGAGPTYAHLSGTAVFYFNTNDRLKIENSSGLLNSVSSNVLSIYRLN